MRHVCNVTCAPTKRRGAVSPRLRDVAAWRATRRRLEAGRAAVADHLPPAAAGSPPLPPTTRHGCESPRASSCTVARCHPSHRLRSGSRSRMSRGHSGFWVSLHLSPRGFVVYGKVIHSTISNAPDLYTKIEGTRLVGVGGTPSGRGKLGLRHKHPVSHPCWLRRLQSVHFLLIRSALILCSGGSPLPVVPKGHIGDSFGSASSLGCPSSTSRSVHAAQRPVACLRVERPQIILSDARS